MTSKKIFSGIIMNQQLSNAGLLDDFYRAANKKDRNTMIAILVSVELEQTEAEDAADTILNNPAFS